MADLEDGADDLKRLGRTLKDIDGDLRKALLQGIRDSNKPTLQDIRRNILTTLPRRGGLAALVARSPIDIDVRTAGDTVGVEIRPSARMKLAEINRGRLRHPVFGNRKAWVEQQVPSGWFDEPIVRDLPEIRRRILQAMQDVANKIERSV